MALKPTQRSLRNWTRQKWQYSSKDEESKPRAKRGRYLPESAWKELSAGEKRATNRAKREGSRSGKQFVKQPQNIASKTAKHRK